MTRTVSNRLKVYVEEVSLKYLFLKNLLQVNAKQNANGVLQS